MGSARWFALKVALVTHLNRCRRVVVGHAPVFDKHARNAVAGGRHDATVIKTKVAQCGRQLRIPILFAAFVAQSQVPFANGTGGIAHAFEHIGHGKLFGTDNHTCISRCNIGVGTPPCVFAR